MYCTITVGKSWAVPFLDGGRYLLKSNSTLFSSSRNSKYIRGVYYLHIYPSLHVPRKISATCSRTNLTYFQPDRRRAKKKYKIYISLVRRILFKQSPMDNLGSNQSGGKEEGSFPSRCILAIDSLRSSRGSRNRINHHTESLISP